MKGDLTMKKSVIAITSGVIGGVAAATTVKKHNNKIINEKIKKADKFKTYYTMLNQWLCIKQENRNLAEYFIKNNYNRVAVYGLGEMGKRLMEELKDTEIEVVYGIDKDIDGTLCDITVYSLEDIEHITERADVVVVTAVFAYEEIKDMICEKLDAEMISLEDVVLEVY